MTALYYPRLTLAALILAGAAAGAVWAALRDFRDLELVNLTHDTPE